MNGLSLAMSLIGLAFLSACHQTAIVETTTGTVPGRSSTTESTPFAGGHEGYACYRAPALVVSGKGTVLAFCEGVG